MLLRRAVEQFGDVRYARLSQISVSHLYNLRGSEPYRKQRLVWRRTRPAPVAMALGQPLGIRKAPAPRGMPGYIRIDTVHQGDLDGLKGVYRIAFICRAAKPMLTKNACATDKPCWTKPPARSLG